MSSYRKTGRRCDGCGKFTMTRDGEYRRADGTAGYINSEEQDAGRDFCSDCRDAGRDQPAK